MDNIHSQEETKLVIDKGQTQKGIITKYYFNHTQSKMPADVSELGGYPNQNDTNR